jgi:PPOX class probable FMN-dependent enzyme
MAKDFELKPEFLVNTEDELRSFFPPTHAVAVDKCQESLDKHARDFIARAPFLCIGTQSADGSADVSPRGDPCGFVKVLDEHTLIIPDRPGNNRLDTQANIVANPAVGLLFMIPGFDDTLRINGTARISRDPELLQLMMVRDRLPLAAIVVTVQEVFLHCAKAFRRSKLWDPDQLQDRSDMPSLRQIILDQTSAEPVDPEDVKRMDAELEANYQRTMY